MLLLLLLCDGAQLQGSEAGIQWNEGSDGVMEYDSSLFCVCSRLFVLVGALFFRGESSLEYWCY